MLLSPDPAAPAVPLPAGTVTLVMTDVEGSTRLFRRLGEHYARTLQTHRALIRSSFVEHGGVEVDAEGDGLFFAFADAAAALGACLKAQRALAGQAWIDGVDVRVRIGAHTGELRPSGPSYVDLAVHRVARICAGAHGGQVVLSEATAADARNQLPNGADLIQLGSFQLRGFPDSQRLYQLAHPDLQRTFPPLRLLGIVVHNLPFQRSAFVGRSRDKDALTSLLRQHGIVSIVGLGGVGKTRLAVQVGFDIMDRYRDGVWLVELAVVADSKSVLPIIAQTVRAPESPGRSIDDVLVEALENKNALLVLDSCERHLEVVAAVAELLVRRCPQLQILATSREPLDIDGEVVWRLSPMSTIDPDRVLELKDVVGWEAVVLFVERARLVTQFELSDDNAADVARIVARVNGIPLAIELAAAALGDRPLIGLLNALTDRLSVLTIGRRAGPVRHQTLRAALEWSLDLLADEERRLFARLAAFVGGATTEAITNVCQGACPSQSIPRMLRHLARVSLLVPHPTLPDRWSMLDSVREMATLELDAAGESSEIAARHRRWYVGGVERVEGDVGRTRRPEIMRDLTLDHDNIRRAIDSAISAEDGESALRICAAMAPFWTAHGDWTEGSERLRAALRAAGRGPPGRTDGQSWRWQTSCCCEVSWTRRKPFSSMDADLRRRQPTTRSRPVRWSGRAIWRSDVHALRKRRRSGRRRCRRPNALVTIASRARSFGAWPSRPAAAVIRNGPEASSAAESSWPEGRGTTSNFACCSARSRRPTYGSGTTAHPRTPTAMHWPWPPG